MRDIRDSPIVLHRNCFPQPFSERRCTLGMVEYVLVQQCRKGAALYAWAGYRPYRCIRASVRALSIILYVLVTGCNCVTYCSLASRCSCKVAGIPCSTLCHKGRGGGGNKLGTLFSDLCGSNEDEDKEEEADKQEEEDNEKSSPEENAEVKSTPL
jgi:hypothetical protein